MSLAAARAYMQTIPGAAMTAPWYLQHFKAVDAANRGDMRAVLAVVARGDRLGDGGHLGVGQRRPADGGF
ncbi:hypothetical protein [Roseococcus sp.]|uniref:hypothetical protein n=1 Tax=Roseococcus sp. TaxID=2109646 RepID=UPI003BAD0B9A